MNFWERVEEEVERQNTSFRYLARKLGRSETTVSGWRTAGTLPRVDDALALAATLGTTIEYLVSGDEIFRRPSTPPEECEEPDPHVYPVPILNQRVAAGRGQDFIDAVEIVGTLPFLKRMFRGEDPGKARALEVRGDSMTGVEMFDGDLVVFVPGAIRSDGIYVLRVGDELIVKRVEFDLIERKLRIMSENPRYAARVESADSQAVEIVGKVYGWVHAHPY